MKFYIKIANEQVSVVAMWLRTIPVYNIYDAKKKSTNSTALNVVKSILVIFKAPLTKNSQHMIKNTRTWLKCVYLYNFLNHMWHRPGLARNMPPGYCCRTTSCWKSEQSVMRPVTQCFHNFTVYKPLCKLRSSNIYFCNIFAMDLVSVEETCFILYQF